MAPYGRADQLHLVIHEFGHALAKLGQKHGKLWGEGAAMAGAMITANMAAVR